MSNVQIVEADYNKLYEKLCHVLASPGRDLLEQSFDVGGYVAGGAARWLARNAFTDVPTFRERWRRYITDGGDLDIFFPTREPADAIALDMSIRTPTARFSVWQSPFKFAHNVKTNCAADDDLDVCPINVQLVTCAVGSPQEVIGAFDVRNAMIGFDRTRTWHDAGWGDAERSKRLDIVCWESPQLVYRIRKYLQRNDYDGLHEKDRVRFVELLITKLQDTLSTPTTTGDEKTKKERFVTFMNALPMVKSTEKLFTDDDLLLLSGLLGMVREWNYNEAFNALKVRQGYPHPRDLQQL